MAEYRKPRGGKTVHILFLIGILAKAVDGVLEVIGGLFLLFVEPAHLHRWLAILTQHELSRAPNDAMARLLLGVQAHLTYRTRLFGAIYLLVHGVVKIGLVAALLRRELWAYPTAIIVFALFIVYQLYRYTITGGFWLVVLSVVDLFVIVLTWLEYRRLRSGAV
jgi:uncharacterized membrane protein